MLRRVTRRGVAAAAVVAMTATLVAACGDDSGSGSDGKITLRYSWWGPAERAEIMNKAIARFEQQNPNIKITPNFSDYAPYWQKLATETAGGGAPDVMQMDYTYLSEYANRGVLLDLASQVDKNIQIKELLPGLQDVGVIDGKRYGITVSGNTFALIYDPAAFEKAGVTVPDAWTWKEYQDAAAKVGKAVKDDKMWGATDYTQITGILETWLRQQNKELISADGKLVVSKEDLKAFWEHGQRMRDLGAIVPQSKVAQVAPKSAPGADLVASAVGIDTYLTRYAGETKRTFAIAPMPSDDPNNLGLIFRPGMLLCASSKTKNPDAAAKLINFMINDAEVGKMFGGNRGLPASTIQREAALPVLSPQDQAVLEYENGISDQLKPAPLPPAGVGPVDAAFLRIGEELNYGKTTIDKAVDQFFTEAEQALSAS
ncbi:MAG: sugar ABC transporter substrate-binding protein [Actinomycetales bacterium]|nr:sugar ABC transporter substrate-binding protein [Actinomycetales bacterium]